MAKYVIKSSGWIEDELWEEDESFSNSIDVCDHESVFTGLLTSDGQEIWKEPNPIGFVW